MFLVEAVILSQKVRSGSKAGDKCAIEHERKLFEGGGKGSRGSASSAGAKASTVSWWRPSLIAYPYGGNMGRSGPIVEP